jgi:hypothetical protein
VDVYEPPAGCLDVTGGWSGLGRACRLVRSVVLWYLAALLVRPNVQGSTFGTSTYKTSILQIVRLGLVASSYSDDKELLKYQNFKVDFVEYRR